MQPGQIWDDALHRPFYEGLHGTILCLECGFFGLGHEHPEWCSWRILKERPGALKEALAIAELGHRVAAILEDRQRQTARLSS